MRYIIPTSYVWDHYPPKTTKEMGNLLNKLTHYINSIEIFYSHIRKQAWTNYHPPPFERHVWRFLFLKRLKRMLKII